MSKQSAWDYLSEKGKNVYVQLGTRCQKTINKLKTQDLIDTVRESKMVGYDEGGPYKMLEHELERRDSNKKWYLAIIAVVVTVTGILINIFIE